MQKFLMGKLSFLTTWARNNWVILLLISAFIPAIADLLNKGFFPMHDDLQIFRLFEFDKCIKDLQIPCRWVPDAGYGYGYPLMQFYPPMPYYPMEILKLIGLGLFWPVKIMFALAFVVSGIGMYKLAKEFFGKLGGVISALFYVYAPYHSVDIYVRGALNEAWGMAWFPFVLLYIYRLITKETTKRDFIFLAISLSLQLTSHNVMTLIFAPSAIVWALFWLWQSKKINLDKIKLLFLSGVLGIGLASFFFLPVVLEQKHVHVDSMISGYFNYMAHYADINQMFFSQFWGFGGSTWGPEDDMAFPIGQFHWVVASIASLIAIFRFKKNKKMSLLILMTTTFAFGYSFLIHSRSIVIWQHLPLLQFAQFPWRLLALVVFYFSFVTGYIATINIKNKIKYPVIATLLVAMFLWNIPFFKVERHQRVTQEEKLSSLQWELQVTGGIFDYLPRSAPKPPGDPAFTFPQVMGGRGSVTSFRSGSNWMEFDANISSSSAQVMLPLFTFPGLRVKVDGNTYQSTPDPDLGRVTIDLEKGNHSISAKIGYTPVRILADLITITSLFILLKLVKNARNRS